MLFLRSYSRADSPLLRQQLKWVTRGTLLAVLPFTLFYAAPFLLDLHPPTLLTNLAGLSLVFLPLTFSWAIVRYRLMDTDLIFKRGVAYTLATGCCWAAIRHRGVDLASAAQRDAGGDTGLGPDCCRSGHRGHLRSAEAADSGMGGPGV